MCFYPKEMKAKPMFRKNVFLLPSFKKDKKAQNKHEHIIQTLSLQKLSLPLTSVTVMKILLSLLVLIKQCAKTTFSTNNNIVVIPTRVTNQKQ